MNDDLDISPKTIEGIISINVCEETALFAILNELEQRFPEIEKNSLREVAQDWLTREAKAGRVGFYYRKWSGDPNAELSTTEGVAIVKRPETWSENWNHCLVAYMKKADSAPRD